MTSGEVIHLEWTVGNFGTAATDTDTWFDRIVASPNDIYGDADDILLGFAQHTGTLNMNETYTAGADVTLPLVMSGLHAIFVHTDHDNRVFEFTFTDNNVLQSASQLDSTQAPLPDLQVENLAVSGPTDGTFTIFWNTANRGNLAASGGWKERVVVQNLTTGMTLVDTQQDVTDALAVNETLGHSFIVAVGTAGS